MCRREAPDVEQFARAHEDEIRVVGLGAQDSLGDAEEFVERFGTTFPMLWDESFEAWIVLGVTSTPTALLLAPDGEPIAGWIGAFPEDEVLRLAAESTS